MAKMMGPRFKQSRRLGLNVCGQTKEWVKVLQETTKN